MYMTGIRRYYRLWKLYTAKSIKAVMSYRWSFLINCISQALDYRISFLLMWIMITAFNGMNGWNSYEVMMLYSTSLFSYGIAGTFFFTIFLNLPNMIHTGNFDDVLVKPVRVLPYLISSNFMCNIVTVIIPYGMMNYYPLKLMFHKQDIAFGDGFAYAFPAFTIVFFVLANVYFVLCRRLYTSSGS